jgi:hypothetical protein
LKVEMLGGHGNLGEFDGGIRGFGRNPSESLESSHLAQLGLALRFR